MIMITNIVAHPYKLVSVTSIGIFKALVVTENLVIINQRRWLPKGGGCLFVQSLDKQTHSRDTWTPSVMNWSSWGVVSRAWHAQCVQFIEVGLVDTRIWSTNIHIKKQILPMSYDRYILEDDHNT